MIKFTFKTVAYLKWRMKFCELNLISAPQSLHLNIQNSEKAISVKYTYDVPELISDNNIIILASLIILTVI